MSLAVIAIGASTGGTEAIKTVLGALPEHTPPVLIVQHMPESFTTAFARRLDEIARLAVREAQGGELLAPGTAYLAPGHAHLLLRKRAGRLITELSASPAVGGHRPAVDVLFHSVAEVAGHEAIGVLLTGMGKDGAQGLLAMRRAGAWTIAQDEATSVVYGMPRAAAALGAACETVPLDEIAARILARLGR